MSTQPEPSAGTVSELLTAALSDPDVRRSRAAVQSLLAMSGEAREGIVRSATKALVHTDSLIQRRAAQILAALSACAAAAVPALIAASRSRGWTVREAVVQALARVGDGAPESTAALVERALHDRHALVRTTAAGAIALLPAAASALAFMDLQKGLAHARHSLRCRALRGLGHFQDRREAVVSLVRRALDDSHQKVRQAAAEVLAQLGTPALAALPQLVRLSFDGALAVQRAATAALTQLSEQAPSPLWRWLERLLQGGASPDALRAVLESDGLPAEVRQELTAVCERRVRWHGRLAGETAISPCQEPTAWGAACAAMALAERAARTHRQDETAARRKEQVWLTIRLVGLLQASLTRGSRDSP